MKSSSSWHKSSCAGSAISRSWRGWGGRVSITNSCTFRTPFCFLFLFYMMVICMVAAALLGPCNPCLCFPSTATLACQPWNYSAGSTPKASLCGPRSRRVHVKPSLQYGASATRYLRRRGLNRNHPISRTLSYGEPLAKHIYLLVTSKHLLVKIVVLGHDDQRFMFKGSGYKTTLSHPNYQKEG